MITEIAVFGLILDIIGAFLLAIPIFFSSVDDIANNSYRRNSASAHKNSYFSNYGFERALTGCKEQLKVRLGLCLLILGFMLQILANLCIAQIYVIIEYSIPLIFVIVVSCYHDYLKTKEDVTIELVFRSYSRRNDTSVSGRDPSEVIKAINYMLPHKLENKDKGLLNVASTWVSSEIEKRYDKYGELIKK